MVIVPEQATIVKEIFHDILSGKTSSQIADELNDRGIVSARGGRWRGERIDELVANEKYVGDALFHKTYTDSSFTRHRNHGACNQYLITEHHEPIVTHKVFDRANAIIKMRRKGNCDTKKYQNRYGFSGKIICGECGSIFKRRIHYTVSGSYTAWCCKKHLQNINACSMKFVSDDSLRSAFLIMINKLIFGRKYVLTPLLRKLQKEKSRLCTDSREEKIAELERLIRFTGENSYVEEYSDILFLAFVDHIRVVSRQEVEFHLKCGLTLTEELI